MVIWIITNTTRVVIKGQANYMNCMNIYDLLTFLTDQHLINVPYITAYFIIFMHQNYQNKFYTKFLIIGHYVFFRNQKRFIQSRKKLIHKKIFMRLKKLVKEMRVPCVYFQKKVHLSKVCFKRGEFQFIFMTLSILFYHTTFFYESGF